MVTYLPGINKSLTMANQVILEEANGEEKKDIYIEAMMLIGIVAISLLTLFQIGSSFRFYMLTRNIREVGWMLHVINILTIISGILFSCIFWRLFKYDTESILYAVCIIGQQSSTMARYRFMMRLIRVQLQIMSEKELTKIIIKQIGRS